MKFLFFALKLRLLLEYVDVLILFLRTTVTYCMSNVHTYMQIYRRGLKTMHNKLI